MAIFMEKLQKAREHEKRVKSSSQVHLGQDPPTQAELDRMAALRAEHAAHMRAREGQAAACRTETELHVAGALSIRSVAGARTEAAPDHVDVGSNSGATANHVSQSLEVKGDATQHCTGDEPPDHIIHALQSGTTNNDLAKRAFSQRRFIQAARLIVVRFADLAKIFFDIFIVCD